MLSLRIAKCVRQYMHVHHVGLKEYQDGLTDQQIPLQNYN
jgi:hypothetical protein